MACEEGMDEDQHAYEKDWGSDIKRDQFHETENIEDETDSNQYEEDQLFHHEMRLLWQPFSTMYMC